MQCLYEMNLQNYEQEMNKLWKEKSKSKAQRQNNYREQNVESKDERSKYHKRMQIRAIAILAMAAILYTMTCNMKVYAADTHMAYVSYQTVVPLKVSPTEESKLLNYLYTGQRITVLSETENGYVKVKNKMEQIGYVSKEFVTIMSDEEAEEEYWLEAAQCTTTPELLTEVVVTKDHSSADRNYNMQKACDKIDGLVLKPGEVFSWYGQNGVGPATKENGYKKTTILENGVGVPGYGGGVCQVATAMYNCIYNIGIEADEVAPHSKPQPYVKEGMVEATVSYGTQNFMFRNRKDYSIMFRAYAQACGEKGEGGQVIMKIYKVTD